MIVESNDTNLVRSFLAPRATAGSFNADPASTSTGIIASEGRATSVPELGEMMPALDPEDACQRAIEAGGGGLVVHRAHPLNCETSIPALLGGVVMPNAHFYVRNHFEIPALDPSAWQLSVGGLVERPLDLSLRDLTNMPSETLFVTLECAGNGRTKLDPPVEGEKWDFGAVSTAEWTGVPLVEVLDRAGIRPTVREVVFRGADAGMLPGKTDKISFERSLTLDDATDSDALLVYAMNGEPLPIQHGYPLRLVIPGWYAVASVKWLTEIEAIEGPFTGQFQTGSYFYEGERDGVITREPVTLQRVRSLITEPRPDEEIELGDVAIRGVTWSGAAPIERVDVRVGDRDWQDARLIGRRHRHSWQWWELITRFEERGETTIRARATDLAGRKQPNEQQWNRLGYGNNLVHEVSVHVR